MPFILLPSDEPSQDVVRVMAAVEAWLRYLDARRNRLPIDINLDTPLFASPSDGGYGISRPMAEAHLSVLDRYVRSPPPQGVGYPRPSGPITLPQFRRQLPNGTLTIITSRDLIGLCCN